MGLGKSLSMIALILAHPLLLSNNASSHQFSKGTLLVVPLNGKDIYAPRQTGTEDIVNSVGNLGSAARQVRGTSFRKMKCTLTARIDIYTRM